MRKRGAGRGAAAVAAIAAALVAPAAQALSVAGVSAPAELPAAPQVRNPLPPLSSAVPVAASHPSAPVPAPAAIASPSATAPIATATAPLHVTATSVAAAPASASAPSPAGAPDESAPGPSAAEVRRQHAAQQTRRLRRAVLRMEGCLASLPERQHDYLTLRAGLGREHPLARAAAAKRVGLPRSRARAFERRALRALRGVCSPGAGPGTGAAHTSFAVAVARTTAGLRTTRVEPVAERTQGEHQVLGVHESHRQPQQRGEGKGKVAPSVIGRTTGAIPEPPAGNSPSELWIVAALAALAALAGAALVRRRASRLNFAVAAPPEAAAGAAAAGAAVTGAPPSDPSQQLVSRALDSLSWGDVEGAAELMHPDVRWPDPGNGTIEGRDRFEEYWNRRLSAVSIDIEPVSFERRNGELMVEVNEIVRSRLTHTTIGEYHAVRRFSFRDGLIAEMKHGRA